MGNNAVRVLGVDPGTRVSGWAVVQGPLRDARAVAHGVWHLRGSLSARLAELARRLEEVLTEFSPQVVALERNFSGENVQSALRLGEARGAILAAVGGHGLPVVEYTPATVKLAVAGSGRASKEQIQAMVARLLSLPDLPPSDAADALALALCHLQTSPLAQKLPQSVGGLLWRRGRIKRIRS